MSTATPAKPPSPSSTATSSAANQRKLLHNLAVAGLVVCPAIILLPPRKLDLYTMALLTGTLVSANHLTTHYSGRDFATRWGERFNSVANTGELPPKAAEMQERLRQERQARDRKFERQALGKSEGTTTSSIVEQVESKMREEKERSFLKKVWYGEEGEDWKQKRKERERKALAEGKGYSDLIVDQIWEVWNWAGEKGKDEGEKKTEEVKKKEEGKK